MFILTSRLVVVALLALSMLVPGSTLSAAGRRHRMASGPTHGRPTYGRSAYSQQAQAARAAYPKYYYGFHSRSMQNIGVPTGDVGIRGNGITASPW